MSAAYYPVMLNLENRRVLFIGGGWETAHKVRGLLEAGALVTLLSPFDHPELEGLVGNERLIWERRTFEPGDVAGFWLVMSHTPNKADNAAVYAEAEARGVLCNSVDDPQRCSFILPSVLRRGDLVISVSTSGTAPALGVRIKQRLSSLYGAEYERFLEILRELRPGLTGGFASFDTRKVLWYDLIDSEALEFVAQDNVEEAREVLERVVEERREACQREPCAGCTAQKCLALQSALERVES
jgi:precorrin-2 dehydrogenase / sirohydrochlorin ferrochelatase